MTYALVGILAFALAVALAEIRVQRVRRADRIRAIEQLAHTVGIAAAVKAARSLDWIGESDVRSDGDDVQIRLRSWRPFQR